MHTKVLLGLHVRGEATLKLHAFVKPYSGNPKVRYDTVLASAFFYIKKPIFLPLLGLLSEGKPHLTCIGHLYLWNPNEQLTMFLSINK